MDVTFRCYPDLRVDHDAMKTIILLGVLVLTGCGFTGRELMVSSSPDGRASVVIIEYPHGADADVRIRFTQGSFTTDVDFVGDYGPYYPEVFWRTNTIVGIMVCSSWGGDISAGFDFATRQKVLTSVFRGGIENQIRQKYTPSSHDLDKYSGSPFVWRCNNERDRVAPN